MNREEVAKALDELGVTVTLADDPVDGSRIQVVHLDDLVKIGGVIEKAQVTAPTTAQICEVAIQRGYQAAIADMLWLAKGRDQYDDEMVQFQVRSVQQVARAMSGDEFAHQGWLPSWLWDQWEARKATPWVPRSDNGSAA